jgi:hypothetical protein
MRQPLRLALQLLLDKLPFPPAAKSDQRSVAASGQDFTFYLQYVGGQLCHFRPGSTMHSFATLNKDIPRVNNLKCIYSAVITFAVTSLTVISSAVIFLAVIPLPVA